jgi:hypothetical protein
MRRLSVLFLLLSVLLSACDREGGVVAQVGQFTISRQGVAWRDIIHRLYFPRDVRELGLEELVHAYTAAQILINNGYPITPEVIEAEEWRIQQTTLMPEMLARIKSVFQGNQDGYRRVFVLPTLVERVIYYELFLHDPQAQAKSLDKAEQLLVNAGKNLCNLRCLAEGARYNFSTFTVALSRGIEWHDPVQAPKDQAASPLAGMPKKVTAALNKNNKIQSQEVAERWIKEIVAPLKPGELCEKAIDLGEEWLVVRLLGPTPHKTDSYELEYVSIPKDPYEPWLQSESEKVPIIRK